MKGIFQMIGVSCPYCGREVSVSFEEISLHESNDAVRTCEEVFNGCGKSFAVRVKCNPEISTVKLDKDTGEQDFNIKHRLN